MLKQAIITYFKAFRYENLKKINRHSNVTFGIIALVFYPAIIDLISESNYSLYNIAIPITPILLILYAEMLMQFMISKEIFLVPMKNVERKKYVQVLVGVKILMPVVFGVVLLLLWKIFLDRRWLEVIVLLFAYVSIGIGAGIRSKKNKYTILHYFNFSISALISCIVTGMETSDYQHFGGGIYLYPVLGMAVLLVLDILILVKYYKDYVERICDYEKMFHISRKA